MIEIKNISKSFGGKAVLCCLSSAFGSGIHGISANKHIGSCLGNAGNRLQANTAINLNQRLYLVLFCHFNNFGNFLIAAFDVGLTRKTRLNAHDKNHIQLLNDRL